ncbi:MAG: DUF2232 domain-containing protein [Actinobacteria bacterium]|nr:DUF2232 domain-containing protein [Actinomycetota bacterium]
MPDSALNGRRVVTLAIVAIVGALATVLFHPVIGLPVAGTALAALVYGGRPWASTAASVVGGVLTGLFASATLYVVVFPLVGVPTTARTPYVYTALVICSLVLVGPLTAVMMRKRRVLVTAAIVAGVLTVLQVGTLAVLADGTDMGLVGYVKAAASGVVVEAGLGDDFAHAMLSMWPGVVIAMNGITSMLVVGGVGVAGARAGIEIKRIPPLSSLDLDARVVILPIVAVALLAAGKLPTDAASSLDIVGKNLLVVARWVFFLQGVAVFAGLYERAKFPRPVRAMGFVLLGVTEVFAPAVSLTGLADIWLNLRRLPRDSSKTSPPPEAAGSD